MNFTGSFQQTESWIDSEWYKEYEKLLHSDISQKKEISCWYYDNELQNINTSSFHYNYFCILHLYTYEHENK